MKDIPFIVHEGDMVRLERANKRLLIALITTLIVFITREIISEIQP